jgi:hypothetical protein
VATIVADGSDDGHASELEDEGDSSVCEEVSGLHLTTKDSARHQLRLRLCYNFFYPIIPAASILRKLSY